MLRQNYLSQIERAFQSSKVIALLGPRQCGKTTLARKFFSAISGNNLPNINYFDLENPTDLMRLQDPMLALEGLKGLIVIDEIQRQPELFSVLRVLVDRESLPGKFLVLGSASRELIRQSSESLAGRIHYIEVTPFSLEETQQIDQLWLRGGFPLSYLAHNDAFSLTWRKDYIRTYLEQDIPNLGIKIPAENLRRFWMMLTHYHGQIFNASELARSLDVSYHTVKNYLDILSGTFMVRQLQPWYENISKRQVRAPKVYIRDSGIFHALMNIMALEELMITPKVGASWEGFALESIIKILKLESEECFFWATHGQAELDLFVMRGNKRLGVEIKYTKAPKVTRSMQIAIKDLQLERLLLLYPGEISFPLAEEIYCVGLYDLPTLLTLTF